MPHGGSEMFGLNFEVEYLLFLNSLKEYTGSFLNWIITYVSNFGTDRYIIPIIAFIYWNLNKKYGKMIFLTFAFTSFFSSILKLTFCVYRPYLLDNRLSHLTKANGYSFPSGHASNAAGFLLPIKKCYRNLKIIQIFSIVAIIAICFSRNYLGYHTLTDVLVGVVIAELCLMITGKLLDWADKGHSFTLIIITILISILAIFYINHKTYPNDRDMVGKLYVDPVNSFDGVYNIIGILFGTLVGCIIEEKIINFQVSKNIIAKIVFYIAGMLSVKSIELISLKYVQLPQSLTQFLLMFFITALFPLIIKYFSRLTNSIFRWNC